MSTIKRIGPISVLWLVCGVDVCHYHAPVRFRVGNFGVSGKLMLRACAYRGVRDIQTGFGVREKEEEKVRGLRRIPLVGNVVVVHRGHPLFCTTLTAAKHTFARDYSLHSHTERNSLIYKRFLLVEEELLN